MAKPLSPLLLCLSTFSPPANPRRPANRSRRSALRSSPKSAQNRKAPSAGILAALAALAAAHPLVEHSPCSAAVPDFLCPALVGAPSLVLSTSSAAAAAAGGASSSSSGSSACASGTPAEQQHRAAETASAPAPSPQQVLARSTSTPSCSSSVAVVADDIRTDTVTDANTSANSDTVASRRSGSSRSVAYFSVRTRADEVEPTSHSQPNPKLHFKRADDNDADDNTCSELYTSRTIPDRYELGNDGRWHKLSVWSSCSLCECQPYNIDDSNAGDIPSTGVSNDASNASQEPSSVSATASYTASASSSGSPSAVGLVYPDGWEKKSVSTVYRVPLIVVASLLLAAGVTCAVWFSVFWRRRRQMAEELALARDLEKHRKAEGEGEGSESVEIMDGDGDEDAGDGGNRSSGLREDVYGDRARRDRKGEEKVKARWARATAQWKAHVRWNHRRRRGRTGIIDGMKQRDDAMASGVSLAHSVASSRVGSASGSVAGQTASDRGRVRRSVPGPVSAEEQAQEPTVYGAEEGREVAVRVVGASSERPRSLRVCDHVRDQDQDQDEGEARHTWPRPRPNLRPRLDLLTAPPPNRNSLTSNSDWSDAYEAYDHPPPAISPTEERDVEGGEEVLGPPAYRSRGNADDEENRPRRPRTRRDEKRAAAPGYVPAPDDCAPYASSDEDEEDIGMDGGERGARRVIGQRSRDQSVRRVQTNMHIAVDDKRALARLEAYASAPPPPPSSPPVPEFSSSPSHASSVGNGIQEANAPPEPEWPYDYAVADVEDSPGAGPGPSTVSARSASPTSPSSPSRQGASHMHVHSPFPAPPIPVSSQLAYAPLDAGLVDPNADLGFGMGMGLDDDLDPADVPSAPPFSAHADSYGLSGPPGGEMGNDDVLAGASAPPLFFSDDDLGLDENGSVSRIDGADSDALANSGEAVRGRGEGGPGNGAVHAESEEPPGTAHVETTDRNAVPSAVR